MHMTPLITGPTSVIPTGTVHGMFFFDSSMCATYSYSVSLKVPEIKNVH